MQCRERFAGGLQRDADGVGERRQAVGRRVVGGEVGEQPDRLAGLVGLLGEASGKRDVHRGGFGHHQLGGRVVGIEAEVAGEFAGRLRDDGAEGQRDQFVRGLGFDRAGHELAQRS